MPCLTRTRGLFAGLLALVVVFSGCASTGGSARRDADPPVRAVQAASAPVVRVVAVGDIACPPGYPVTPKQCQQGATAALARRLDPDLVLTLGDHQYNADSAAEFAASYADSWGALRSITRPTIGNHEYV